NEIDRLELRIYGDGDNLPNILKMISDLGIEDIVTYSGFVSFREISEALKEVNIGVVPTRKNPFSDLNLPVRIFEYLSMNVPVAASFTPGIKDYFEEDELLFFEADNVKSLKSVLLDYYTNPEKYAIKLEKGILVYKSNLWSIEKNKLLQIINDLLK
ncbi:MAG: glycosyltransferase family 4 protein, partial [bacterium]|nr:glycosyltransferase family 4 protein [bacterium]